MPDLITVWTDGACIFNPGPAGWGWCVEQPDGSAHPTMFGSGAVPHSTNQAMEIQAALEGITAVRASGHTGAITVVTDSKYVTDCFHSRWYEGWVRRNWHNSQNKPVANRELWQRLFAVALEYDGNFRALPVPEQSVKWRWVKGHAGHLLNERADELANGAARSQV